MTIQDLKIMLLIIFVTQKELPMVCFQFVLNNLEMLKFYFQIVSQKLKNHDIICSINKKLMVIDEFYSCFNVYVADTKQKLKYENMILENEKMKKKLESDMKVLVQNESKLRIDYSDLRKERVCIFVYIYIYIYIKIL